MTDEERAENAVAILTGKVCATCQYRFPGVHLARPGEPAQRVLLCGADEEDRPEVDPNDSCDRWAAWSIASPVRGKLNVTLGGES